MSTTDLGMPLSGLDAVPLATTPATAKEYTSDQEVRWCPGCGDYAVLKAVQSFLPTLGLRRENIVFVSGIGCSSRFPYYLDTYGMHSIHGRAPSIATGIATTRPDLSVWVVTGDGDALSIGGNHLVHTLRRNVNMTILLFNNRIYGLTKGQYSPTSEAGKVTKSTPAGSVDRPFDPVSLSLGAEATFVARTIDSDRKHLTAVLEAAARHRGTSMVEIYQNCPIFNDEAFDAVKSPVTRPEAAIDLVHGEPITFGAPLEDGSGRGVARGGPRGVGWARGGRDALGAAGGGAGARRARRRPVHRVRPEPSDRPRPTADPCPDRDLPPGRASHLRRPRPRAAGDGRLRRHRPGRLAPDPDRRHRHLDRRLNLSPFRPATAADAPPPSTLHRGRRSTARGAPLRGRHRNCGSPPAIPMTSGQATRGTSWRSWVLTGDSYDVRRKGEAGEEGRRQEERKATTSAKASRAWRAPPSGSTWRRALASSAWFWT